MIEQVLALRYLTSSMNTADAATKPGAGFLSELSAGWRAMPNKGFFFGLLAAWVALFQFLGNSMFNFLDTPSLFGWMDFHYHAMDDNQYCEYVPLVVLALFWWKRKELVAVPKDLWPPALGLVALALALHIFGYMAQQQRISIVAFFLGLYGLTGLAWGREWLRASFFPFFMFAFTMPMAEVADVVTFPLRVLVTVISVGICKCIGLDVIRDGTQIFDAQHTFAYDVAPACSGIRSLTALLALTTVLGFMTYRSGWKRAAMMFASIPLAVAGNVLRLMFIIVTAETFGQEAGNYVHESEWLSLLPYLPVFAAWIWLQRRYHEGGEDEA